MKIYGNKFALDTVTSMFRSGRLPHSILIFGEKGLGKKTFADYLSAAIVCKSQSGVPCGECRACRLALEKHHPDIIFPEKSGKLGTYSIDTCREICSDAYIVPNDGGSKVYVFTDCDNIKQPAQNSLLKMIEEPPGYAYFIFTASSKSVFLPTILSRVTSIGLTRVSNDECIEALAKEGFENEMIQKAVSAFSGNIGMCRDFIADEALRELIVLTRTAADSIINSDEYKLLTVLSSQKLKDRNVSLRFLESLDRVIRDSSVLKYSSSIDTVGCYPEGSVRLSEILSVKKCGRIHDKIIKASSDIRANVNQGLVMTSLCGDIFEG